MSKEWKVICRVSDIPILGSRVVQRPGKTDVALFRNGEESVFALLDKCPHKGGPLSQGIVFGDKVACPLHNWNIELHSGCALTPDVGCAHRFSVQIDGDLVSLSMTELAAAELA